LPVLIEEFHLFLFYWTQPTTTKQLAIRKINFKQSSNSKKYSPTPPSTRQRSLS
jgi:hypothetical protein